MGAAAVSPAEMSLGDGPLFGALPEAIAQHAKPTVLVVKTRDSLSRTMFDQRAAQAETLEAADRAAEFGRSVPARVERWFAESNYHHQEFADLGRLVELKARQGVTISGGAAHAQRGGDDRSHRA